MPDFVEDVKSGRSLINSILWTAFPTKNWLSRLMIVCQRPISSRSICQLYGQTDPRFDPSNRAAIKTSDEIALNWPQKILQKIEASMSTDEVLLWWHSTLEQDDIDQMLSDPLEEAANRLPTAVDEAETRNGRVGSKLDRFIV